MLSDRNACRLCGPQVFDVFIDTECVAIVEEDAGTPLKFFLAQRFEEEPDADGLSIDVVRSLMRQLLSALAHCHARQIMHRDVRSAI